MKCCVANLGEGIETNMRAPHNLLGTHGKASLAETLFQKLFGKRYFLPETGISGPTPGNPDFLTKSGFPGRNPGRSRKSGFPDDF